MTKTGWKNWVVDASIVHMTPDAAAHVRSWLIRISADEDLADHVGGLTYTTRSATYNPAGRLESTLGPHVGLGTYLRANVPPDLIIDFLGHEMCLALDPFDGKQALRRVDIGLEDGVLLPTFDPPAPPVPTHPFPSIAEWMDNNDIDEKDMP